MRILQLGFVLVVGCASTSVEAPEAGQSGSEPDAAQPEDAARPEDAAQPEDASSMAPFFPCGTPEPAVNGLEMCEPGYQRRVGPSTCASIVPRATMIMRSAFPDLDECDQDSDCEDLHLGHCAMRDGGLKYVCVEGCLEDSDCPTGRVCHCGYAVGRCAPAECETSADCEPGYNCIMGYASAGCEPVTFTCQSAEDGCAGALGCEGYSPNPTFCGWGGSAFGCTINQCYQP